MYFQPECHRVIGQTTTLFHPMVRKKKEFTMIKQRKDKNNTEGCWLVSRQLTPPHIGRTVYRHSYPRDSLNRGEQKERERRERVGNYTSKNFVNKTTVHSIRKLNAHVIKKKNANLKTRTQ